MCSGWSWLHLLLLGAQKGGDPREELDVGAGWQTVAVAVLNQCRGIISTRPVVGRPTGGGELGDEGGGGRHDLVPAVENHQGSAAAGQSQHGHNTVTARSQHRYSTATSTATAQPQHSHLQPHRAGIRGTNTGENSTALKKRTDVNRSSDRNRQSVFC